MKRNKTQRKSEFLSHPLALVGHPKIQGQWRQNIGNPTGKLVLELACGKGGFLVQYARTHPKDFIIGIDVKKERLWKAAQMADAENLTNIRLLCENILIIPYIFGPEEIDEIWITFPDPYPKISHEKHRLTSPAFLAAYRRILKKDGALYFKTDNVDLFEYSLANVRSCPSRILCLSDDLHDNPWLEPETYFETDYEARFRAEGEPIRYLKFKFI